MENKPQRYVFLDTETTGLDPEENQILQVAAIVYDDDNEIARLNVHFPLCECTLVDARALQVNGEGLLQLIDTVASRDELKIAAAGLVDFLVTYVTRDSKIIGHNIRFDVDFLVTFLGKLDYDVTGLLNKHQLVDTIAIAFFLHDCGYINLQYFNLDAVTTALGIKNRRDYNIHNAMGDVLMTRDVYFTMRDLLDSQVKDGEATADFNKYGSWTNSNEDNTLGSL